MLNKIQYCHQCEPFVQILGNLWEVDRLNRNFLIKIYSTISQANFNLYQSNTLWQVKSTNHVAVVQISYYNCVYSECSKYLSYNMEATLQNIILAASPGCKHRLASGIMWNLKHWLYTNMCICSYILPVNVTYASFKAWSRGGDSYLLY